MNTPGVATGNDHILFRLVASIARDFITESGGLTSFRMIPQALFESLRLGASKIFPSKR